MKIDTRRYDSIVAGIPSADGPRRPQARATNDGVALILTALHPGTNDSVDIHVAWSGDRRRPKERSLYVEAGEAVHTLSNKKEMGAWVAEGRPLPADLAVLSADLQPLLDAFMEAELLYLKARATTAGAEATRIVQTMKPVWPWTSKKKQQDGFPAPAVAVSGELAAVVKALQ